MTPQAISIFRWPEDTAGRGLLLLARAISGSGSQQRNHDDVADGVHGDGRYGPFVSDPTLAGDGKSHVAAAEASSAGLANAGVTGAPATFP